MRLMEHIAEFRRRLIICAITVAVAAIAGWFLSDMVWDFLRQPVNQIAAENGRLTAITFRDVTGSFDLKLRISIFIAIFIGSPIWLYQIWAFFAPGLTKKEKATTIGFISAATPLFLSGAVCGWYVLPNIVKLLTSFSSSEDALLLDARTYLDFATRLLLSVGVGFVLPVFVVLLNFAGVLSFKTIIGSWRYAVMAIVLFAAITTPAAEVVSMFVIAIPMVLLYFTAALIAYLVDRRRAKRSAAEFAEYEGV